jgi:hypothetical protein
MILNLAKIPKKNTFENIYNQLKKIKQFKESKAFYTINILKSTGKFKVIDDIRKDNDHNLSKHVKVESDSELLNEAEQLLDHCKTLYELIPYCIDILRTLSKLASNAEFIFDTFNVEKNFNLKEISKKVEDAFKNNQLPKKITHVNELIIKQIAKITSYNPNSLINYSTPPLFKIYLFLSDITFRLHESARSLSYAYNLYNEGVRLGYQDIDKYSILYDGMNYRYFIYSALFRVYNVYDKLGHIILDLFEGERPRYLTFENVITKNETKLKMLPPIEYSKKVIESQPYKDLYLNRQQHYHYLVYQEYLSPNIRELIDFELVRIILLNIENQIKIIEMINKIFFPMIHMVTIVGAE